MSDEEITQPILCSECKFVYNGAQYVAHLLA